MAIETGIQNVGVAFLIIFTNLPSPEADYAAMPIIAVATLTTVPLFLTYFAKKTYKTIMLKRDAKKNSQIAEDAGQIEEKKDIVLLKEHAEHLPMIEKKEETDASHA